MINFVSLFNELKGQRYFSIIIHSKPNTGLSDFAKKAAGAIGANYIDLLDVFLDDSRLSENIQQYSDQDFQRYFLDEIKKGKPIVVDNIDFLLDTWNKNEIKAFMRMFNKQWDTFNPTYKAPLIAFMETNTQLHDTQLCFEDGTPKVYELSQFNAF